MFAACYPNLYLFKISAQELIPVWHRNDARSNAVLIEDFDGNGHAEFYYNNGSEIVGYTSAGIDRPPAPYPFEASALDSQRILLKWANISSADFYNIYRASSSSSLKLHAEVRTNSFIDSSLALDQTFFYAVTTVDSSNLIAESAFSNIDSARTSLPPVLESLQAANDRQLILTFNEIVQLSLARPYKMKITSTGQQAVSAVLLKNQRDILCSFNQPFESGREDTITVENVFDMDGVPLDSRHRSLPFVYYSVEQEPYISEARLSDRFTIILNFSEPMLLESLTNLENYRLFPGGKVIEAIVLEDDFMQIELKLSRKTLSGAPGQASYIQVENMYSQSGVLLRNGSKINLFTPVTDLDKLVIYPQPLRPINKELIFANLPQNVEIHIFNMRGDLIKTLTDETSYGGICWDLREKNGGLVHSGIYFYRIIHNNIEKIGKFVILR